LAADEKAAANLNIKNEVAIEIYDYNIDGSLNAIDGAE
jgi:hypothetical protein